MTDIQVKNGSETETITVRHGDEYYDWCYTCKMVTLFVWVDFKGGLCTKHNSHLAFENFPDGDDND